MELVLNDAAKDGFFLPITRLTKWQKRNSILMIYLRKLKNESKEVGVKIEKAIAEGVHEPVSLHPYIDLNTCIKSGACIIACPEHDILGIRNGRATLINASKCVGHGACLALFFKDIAYLP